MLKFAELVVVESAGGERDVLRLVGEGLEDLWVAVTLVHGRVCAEEVKVALAIHVPHKHARTTREHH